MYALAMENRSKEVAISDTFTVHHGNQKKQFRVGLN